MKYLTEQLLGDFLKKLYGENNVIAQVPLDGTRMRMDYQVKTHGGDTIYVEFDGDSHYCKPDVIYRDEIKNAVLGDKLVRIPYFIQLDEFTINHYFKVFVWDHPQLIEGVDYNYYPHGFISDKVIFPSQFCSRGIDRFFSELKIFDDYDYGDALGRTLKVSTQIRFSLVEHKSKFQKHAYPTNKVVTNDVNTLKYAFDLIPGAFPLIFTKGKMPSNDEMCSISRIAKNYCKVVVIAGEEMEETTHKLISMANAVYRMTINSHLDDLRNNIKSSLPPEMDEDDVENIVQIVFELRDL